MGAITESLVSFITQARFSDLTDDVVHETKRVLLDSVGCAIGGLTIEMGKIAVRLARRLGGPRESTIIGTGDKVSCVNAAFANGELINALDYDAGAVGHDSPIVIAASLAPVESVKVPGQDLLLAIALGHEISTRLMLAEGGSLLVCSTLEDNKVAKVAFREDVGYACTTIAAAVSAGKILNLTREKMANALGIAAYICPPNALRKYLEVSPVRMTKYHVFGWGAQAGVTSALLADMGFTGDTEVFDGDHCFWKFTGHPYWDTEQLLQDLGEKWLHKISYKQYPIGF
jgi:2-methylcitrate dehydratase PrpD